MPANSAPQEYTGEFLAILRVIGDVGKVGGPLLVGLVAQVFQLGVSPLLVGGSVLSWPWWLFSGWQKL